MKRSLAIDIARIACALMVVGIHLDTGDPRLESPYHLFSNGLFRLAVPMFLLLNGYYFHQVMDAGGIATWLRRIVLMYVGWMLIYAGFWFEASPRVIPIILVGYYHLWYLPAMLGAGLLLWAARGIRDSHLVVLIAATFAAGVVIQYVGNYHLLANPTADMLCNKPYAHRNFLLLGFPFMALGHLLWKWNAHARIRPPLAIALAVVGVLLLLLESWLSGAHSPIKLYDNYAALIVVCPALLLCLLQVDRVSPGKNLALYATGIYFTHPLMIYLLARFLGLHGPELLLMTVLASLIASFALILLQRRWSCLL